jgi:hypothetical protein
MRRRVLDYGLAAICVVGLTGGGCAHVKRPVVREGRNALGGGAEVSLDVVVQGEVIITGIVDPDGRRTDGSRREIPGCSISREVAEPSLRDSSGTVVTAVHVEGAVAGRYVMLIDVERRTMMVISASGRRAGDLICSGGSLERDLGVGVTARAVTLGWTAGDSCEIVVSPTAATMREKQ